MAAINFKTFIRLVPYVTAIRKPVLVRGRHGVGKSEVVYQLAKILGMGVSEGDASELEEGFAVVERRASQMTEGDLVGLPVLKDDRTAWNPPDWFKDACERGVVLFLDEVDRASMEVRQGIFELTDSRKLNGHHLHPDTLVFAAVNGGEYGGHYQVGEMDPAELDRWTVFDVEPSVEDWLNWAAMENKNTASGTNIHPLIWDFINNYNEHLEFIPKADGFDPNKVYPSRRSWTRYSECLENGGLLPNRNVDASELSDVLILGDAFIGFEGAVAFRDYIQTYKFQVSVEDLLDLGQIERTKDFKINQHNAMIDKFSKEKVLDEEMSETRLHNLARYFITLPSEVAMKLWTCIGKGNANNNIRLHQHEVKKGVMVHDYLIDILETGDEEGGKKEDEKKAANKKTKKK